MLIIDSQVHAYERNHPGRPWVGVLTGPDEVTGDAMGAAMEAVGVAGAVLVSPFSLYGYDASYALEVYRQHPGRFGLIKPVNPQQFPLSVLSSLTFIATERSFGRLAIHGALRQLCPLLYRAR
jgi:predicted TIM-barrel fold metal-dependent hydrolase